ncbi:MAG: DNA polymerase II [Acidobacteria bacterium]|nr:DNA polymerase II [Acidobacteriota bacterium]
MSTFEADVKIIDISYYNHAQKKNGEEEKFPVLEIFGRTREGESITLLYPRFLPYFYILNPAAEVRQQLSSDAKVKSVEDTKLFHEGAEHPAVKVTLYVPGDTPAFRDRYHGIAADILFRFRFLYDMGLGYCMHATGTDIPSKQMGGRRYLTDRVAVLEEAKEVPYFASPLKIFSFDIENIIGREILCIGIVTQFGDKRETQMLEGGERKILEDFSRLIKEGDYDILSGYNVCNYDFPYMEDRAKKLGITLDIGRNFRPLNVRQMGGGKNGDNKKVVDKGTNKQVEVTGRVVVDSWYFARKEKRPKRETLNAMAEMILGKQKLPMDTTKLEQEWAQNAEKVKEYCLQDTVLSHEILEKIRVVDKYEALASVARLPLFDIFSDRTSVYIDSLFIREADANKVAVPNTRRTTGDDSEAIEGGYVHQPIAGLYDRVVVFDFASLYPSVILQNNICTTTLSDEGTIVSPLGVKFLSREVKEGMLPRIMRGLLQARRESKKLMKQAKTQEEREYYNRLQSAQKILANAHFGVFSSKFYRFTDVRIGGSITAFARQGTKSMIETLQNEGYQIVYSDTDSLFLVSPFKTIEETVEFGEKIVKRFSHGDISLEMEKIMDPLFLSGAKKRYFGRIVYPNQEILVRGFETRRGDSFNLQTRSLEALFEYILNRDPDAATEYCRGVLKNLERGTVDLEDLVISKTAADESSYKVIREESESSLYGDKTVRERRVADSLPVVQAMKKARERGLEISPGMKVSWIVVDSSTAPQRVEPYLDGLEFKYTPDYAYYRDRLLDSYLRVLEVFGVRTEDLHESRQLSLF